MSPSAPTAHWFNDLQVQFRLKQIISAEPQQKEVSGMKLLFCCVLENNRGPTIRVTNSVRSMGLRISGDLVTCVLHGWKFIPGIVCIPEPTFYCQVEYGDIIHCSFEPSC